MLAFERLRFPQTFLSKLLPLVLPLLINDFYLIVKRAAKLIGLVSHGLNLSICCVLLSLRRDWSLSAFKVSVNPGNINFR